MKSLIFFLLILYFPNVDGDLPSKDGQHDVTSLCKNREDGNYVNPNACDQFICCSNQTGYIHNCYDGLFFNPITKNCITRDEVPCTGPTSIPEKTGCGKDMRLFGDNNEYSCHCKKLAFCDFRNNGKCKNEECQSGYGGPFCQKKLYHQYLSLQSLPNFDVFTNISKKIKSELKIILNNKYNINQMRMICKPSNQVSANISLYIDKTKFCEITCTQTAHCTGDISGKELSIISDNEIEVSNLEMTGCSPFWFGENCNKKCHCANNSKCHMITGSCPIGCESGRSGADCQTLNYINVALNGKAAQSSMYDKDFILVNGKCKEQKFKSSAQMAVDGNNDQQPERLSCIQTEKEKNPWWSVTLNETYNIHQIRIYRGDTQFSNNLTGFNVYVDKEKCKNIPASTEKNSKILDIFCSSVLRGNKVEIQGTVGTDRTLQICEVEILQCLSGFYGNRCSNSCPECAKSLCEQKDGKCLHGCAPGYSLNSSNTCTACPIGTFGERCSKTCKCKNDQNCNRENGTCGHEGCEIGYRGYNCQEFCPIGTFGDGCYEICHCKNDDECNKQNGTCGPKGCQIGYKGFNCQQYNYIIIIGISISIASLVFIILAGCVIYFRQKSGDGLKESRSPRVLNISTKNEIDSVTAPEGIYSEILPNTDEPELIDNPVYNDLAVIRLDRTKGSKECVSPKVRNISNKYEMGIYPAPEALYAEISPIREEPEGADNPLYNDLEDIRMVTRF